MEPKCDALELVEKDIANEKSDMKAKYNFKGLSLDAKNPTPAKNKEKEQYIAKSFKLPNNPTGSNVPYIFFSLN